MGILKINLNKKEPHMAYHAILKVKSGYSVGTTPLNKKELGKIDTEATQSIHTQNRAHGLTMTPSRGSSSGRSLESSGRGT